MSTSSDANRVHIFDTTLRDGEQSPGISLNTAEKVEIAQQLARLGVDVIEAGFPITSPGDFEAVEAISRQVEGPAICGLARTHKADIDAAWGAVRHAERPRIHTFVSTSDIHIEHQLQTDREDVKGQARAAVALARSYCEDVEFSPMDATRADVEFTAEVCAIAVEEGATVVNIPDTVGYTTPEEFGRLIKGIVDNTPGIENAIVSVHCHDDLGLATANTLAGIQAGARQAEVTINGIGERAGNTSLEEVVMTLLTRRSIFGLETQIDTTQIARVSRMVSNYTGIPVQPNKAIVGANAFAHEAGIHQDGMLKNNMTYEIMRPETVGLNRSRLVLGKHSGRHALKAHLTEMGYELTQEELDRAFERYKELADKKKTITDADLEALVEEQAYQTSEVYSLEGLQVACGTMGMPTATVRLRGPDGSTHDQAMIGTGPVHATYQAIDAIVGVPNTLLEFHINAITEGIDAMGEVTVRLQADNGSIPHAPSAVTAQIRTSLSQPRKLIFRH
jgi:2-isopropylmalate synthase